MVITAEFYNPMREWKVKICLELMSQCPPDRVEIAEWSGFCFTTPKLVEICSTAIATLAGGVVEVSNATRTSSTAAAAKLRTTASAAISEHS